MEIVREAFVLEYEIRVDLFTTIGPEPLYDTRHTGAAEHGIQEVMCPANEFDRIVGRVAGAVYAAIAGEFTAPPDVLIPAITSKVRGTLEPFTDVRLLTREQIETLANDLRIAIALMLSSYEIDEEEIERMGPVIEAAVLTSLREERI